VNREREREGVAKPFFFHSIETHESRRKRKKSPPCHFLSSTRRRTSQQTETRKPTRCASPTCSFSCSPSSGPLRRSPGGGRRGIPQARRPRRRLQERGALVSKVRQKLLRFDLFCFVCCFVHSTLFSSPTSFPPPPYPSKPPHSPKNAIQPPLLLGQAEAASEEAAPQQQPRRPAGRREGARPLRPRRAAARCSSSTTRTPT